MNWTAELPTASVILSTAPNTPVAVCCTSERDPFNTPEAKAPGLALSIPWYGSMKNSSVPCLAFFEGDRVSPKVEIAKLCELPHEALKQCETNISDAIYGYIYARQHSIEDNGCVRNVEVTAIAMSTISAESEHAGVTSL